MKTPKAVKLPSGSWRARVTINGECVSITRQTKREAENAAMLAKAEARNNIRNAASVSASSISLADACDAYIKSREAVLSPSTVVGYRDVTRNRFRAYMSQPLTKIPWQQAVNAESRVCSPKTLRNAYRFISSVYRFHGLELPRVTLPALAPPERPWLTPEQIPVFVSSVHGTPCEIPALLALSSLRKSEVCGLAWDDVVFDDAGGITIRVRAAKLIDENGEWKVRDKTKTSASRRLVPVVIPALATALRSAPDKSGLVVRVHPETIYRQINKVCRDADLPAVGWHGLRHSFASLSFSVGIDQRSTEVIGGWEKNSPVLQKIYTHLSDLDRGKNIEKLASFFTEN